MKSNGCRYIVFLRAIFKMKLFIMGLVCLNSMIAVGAQNSAKPRFNAPAEGSFAVVYKPLSIQLIPGHANLYQNTGTCFGPYGIEYFINSYQIEVYSYTLKKVVGNINVYGTAKLVSAAIPANVLKVGSNRLTVRCNGMADIQNQIIVNGLAKPRDLQVAHRPRFIVPFYDAEVRLAAGNTLSWRSPSASTLSPTCYNDANKLVPVVGWQVRIYSGTAMIFAKWYPPTTYSALIPAKVMKPGINHVRLQCNAGKTIQNTLRLTAVADPVVRRIFTNPKTTQRDSGWPSIASYDTFTGLLWHPGSSRTCYNPDFTKRTPQTWQINQYDYRSVNYPGILVIPTQVFNLGHEMYMSSIQTASLFRGVPYRKSAFKHYPNACKGRPNNMLTLWLVCNGWAQDRIDIPCSKWPDQ